MIEIRRLSHEGDAFERELLASARTDRMSERARRALLAAASAGMVGVAGSAATGTTAATANVHRGVVARAVGSGIAKWIGWGLVGCAIALGGARAMTWHHAGSPPPSIASAPAEDRRQPDMAPPSPAVEAVATSTPTERAPEPQTRSLPSRARSVAASASAHDDATDAVSLSAELSLVETARTAVREGRARDALAALEEHRSRFARGAFEEEAAVLRIEALAKAGESATASRLARSFLDTRPRSPYAARVRRALAALGDGERQ
jgi:hypothetical protein